MMISAIQPNKFCFFFSLRLGAVCVAVTELALTAISLLLLILGAERAQEIAKESAIESPRSHSPRGYILSHGPDYLVSTEFPHKGRQMATVVTFILYTGVVMATTHLLTCLLLFYGAVKGIPRFLLPWISTVFLFLILASFSLLLFAFLPYQGCKAEIFAGSIIMLIVEMHSWLVVFSYYRQLMSTAACRMATNIMANYDLAPPEKQLRVDI